MVSSEVEQAIRNLGSGGFKEGSNLQKGRAYHDIPLPGYESIQTHRGGNAQRVDIIVDALENRLQFKAGDIEEMGGLDIGCSVGGISLGLSARTGCLMTGVDYDANAISLALAIAKDEQLRAHFVHCNVTDDIFTKIVDSRMTDFVVWLSSWMWVSKAIGREKALELLGYVSDSIPIMFFDSAQGPNDGMAGEWSLAEGADGIEETLRENTSYTEIHRLGATGGWRGRVMFLCTRR